MLVSQIALKEHEKIIDDVYRDIIAKNDELFLIDANDKIESELLKIIKKNGIEEGINEIQSELINEIKTHHSYQHKNREWAVIYQILQKLAAQLEHSIKSDQENDENHDEDQSVSADEDNNAGDTDIKKLIESMTERFTYVPQIKSFLKSSLEENPKLNIHYSFAKSAHSKFKIILAKLKNRIRELSAFLGIDCIFMLLAKIMDKSKLFDILMKVIGTILSAGLAIIALLLTFLRWLQNPIEKTLKSLAKLLGIKSPDDDDSG